MALCVLCVGVSSCICLLVTPHGLSARLLCLWDFTGKITGVASPSLLQGIFHTQGVNPHLLHCRWILPLHHLGSSVCVSSDYFLVVGLREFASSLYVCLSHISFVRTENL